MDGDKRVAHKDVDSVFTRVKFWLTRDEVVLNVPSLSGGEDMLVT